MRWNCCWGLPSSSRGRTRPATVPEFQSARVPKCHRRSTVLSSVQILATGQSLFTHRPHHGRPDQCVGLCGTSFGSRCPAVLNTLCAFWTLCTPWTLPTIPPTASGSTQPKTQTEHKQLALAPLEHNEISYKPLYECCLLVLVVTVARSRTRCY